ncbi:MAG: hypothetical protein KAS72_08120 [Phycisphaerales bacterium]|nr:hypothetical protein [Phycisphaerales bacterium]
MSAEPSCEHCKLRRYADRKPRSVIARLWRWHTRWCPGWKAYQRQLTTCDEDTRVDPPDTQ